MIKRKCDLHFTYFAYQFNFSAMWKCDIVKQIKLPLKEK